MARMIDVAKKAGVSIATVSYVLNGNKYVSREYQEKVWKAVKELGYQPNILAQSLRKQETKEINSGCGILLRYAYDCEMDLSKSMKRWKLQLKAYMRLAM
ncbi:MAG TPA: LacI family transcriptional regulator [Clostridiaceae bacterium]|nr:LacI family transcriptional regulator [Clostridiaceae bacterium]